MGLAQKYDTCVSVILSILKIVVSYFVLKRFRKISFETSLSLNGNEIFEVGFWLRYSEILSEKLNNSHKNQPKLEFGGKN